MDHRASACADPSTARGRNASGIAHPDLVEELFREGRQRSHHPVPSFALSHGFAPHGNPSIAAR
jgi:hypothetical protein